MFGSFGCRDNYCNDYRGNQDNSSNGNSNSNKRNHVCNVLANVSIGTKISLLKIKDHGTFRDVIFEGFSCGVALFSEQDRRKWDHNGDHKNGFEGVLRVCPDDIIAIAI